MRHPGKAFARFPFNEKFDDGSMLLIPQNPRLHGYVGLRYSHITRFALTELELYKHHSEACESSVQLVCSQYKANIRSN
jgi:hypothetical protein